MDQVVTKHMTVIVRRFETQIAIAIICFLCVSPLCISLFIGNLFYIRIRIQVVIATCSAMQCSKHHLILTDSNRIHITEFPMYLVFTYNRRDKGNSRT
jgi:hypothetical protein